MLDSFRVAHFKSFDQEARLDLSALTVLVGANAAGKSNLLEALQLLAWLARGRRLGELHSAMRHGELPIRGAPEDLTVDSVVLGCQVSAGLQLDLSLTLDLVGRARVVAEELECLHGLGPDEQTTIPWLYRVVAEAQGGGSDLRVEYNNFSRGRTKPHITCMDQQAVFTQLLTPARFEHAKAQRVIPSAAEIVASALGSVIFLDPAPRAMRQYSFKSDKERLASDGANLSAVLHDICETQGRPGDVLDFVRGLPEREILGVSFLKGPRDDVMVTLLESFANNDGCEAALLSDGTLRVLAIAAALLSAQPESLVVIEEIDNGIHPPRARGLLSKILEVAKARKLHVLITTHDPALLDAVPAEVLPDVCFCYRDPETGGSRLVRLQDLDDYPALVAQGPLGALVTSSVLDRTVKRRTSAEERQRQLDATLDLFTSPS